jgi:hypothetical protein
MNHYEEKQAAKKQRLEDRAAAASREAQATYSKARKLGEMIPFGQPILVGHHSEGRDRNYRAKIHNTYGKAFALHDQAQALARRAESVGTGGISSDDPDAVTKLRRELEGMEAMQNRMKAANKAIKANKTPESQVAALVDLGFDDARACGLIKPDYANRIGFATYQLSNNNANMRRIKGRIEELEKAAQRTDVEREGEGYTYREDTTENRVMFLFDGKPPAEVRDVLKRHAFKWSPSRGAWVRHLNNAGIYAANQVIEALN